MQNLEISPNAYYTPNEVTIMLGISRQSVKIGTYRGHFNVSNMGIITNLPEGYIIFCDGEKTP